MGVASFTKSGVVNYAKFRSALSGEDPFVPPIDVEYVVIAGGGSGGNQQSASTSGGAGGGAGGYRSSVSGESSGGGASAESALSITLNTAYTVTIGAGGAGPATHSVGANGNNSVFASITSTGGGGGSGGAGGAGNGGSGGGANVTDLTGGTGTANQGFDGGDHDNTGGTNGAAGGGGAGAVGGNNSGTTAGAGGAGVSSSITGSAITRAGGGGGSAGDSGTGASGGSGGGGKGADGNLSNALSGVVNTGSGGGGHGPADTGRAGNGGSGIVILKYPSSVTLTEAPGLVGTTTTVGENKVTQITAGTGTITFASVGAEAFSDFSPAMLFPDIWLDASDASTITASSGSVSQWDNKGTGSNFVQATSADQPITGVTTLNGLNVIDFDADELQHNGNLGEFKFMHDGTKYFFVVVIDYNSSDTSSQYVFQSNASSSTVGVQYYIDNRNGDNQFEFSVSNGSTGNQPIFVQQDGFYSAGFDIVSAIVDPNAATADRIDYFKNDTDGTETNTRSTTPSTANPDYKLIIGGSSGLISDISVAELIVVSGANATEENRQAVVDYLNAKWSVF